MIQNSTRKRTRVLARKGLTVTPGSAEDIPAGGGITPPLHARAQVDGKFFARNGRRLRVQGVTYGPFAPGPDGLPFPTPAQVADDLAGMAEAGINALRSYHVPPDWLLALADEMGMSVFIDVPWRKHLCFLESADAQAEARDAVRAAAKSGQGHSCVLAYSIGNEIPPEIVRWHGARRVERFLAELADVARQTDPAGLVTYASYPPTEYLDLHFLDFATFNVYLHDRESFHRYLFRLQNLVGDRPLVLGELGMDTLRHGELAQAEFLAGHAAEARLVGLAGLFVFSWTDDWFTGGHRIEDWCFGLTHADRSPKASYHALREVFQAPTSALLDQTPRVSVVVCSYNGGRTLEQCLSSLVKLDYPDYEVILVDDGSTDDTRAIVGRFLDAHGKIGVPAVRVIHQPNLGLSAARNVGLQAATGEVIAYTDSDCFAEADWLTLLVRQLYRSGAAAVGGPNLTPDDGWLAGCVAASPGQPTHVLESDQVAEHIPGCNMAFRREALLAINGFDPQYRKAGDDVDVCWRLQQAGMWITFAPGAFVWHHRRCGPGSYLRQQAGYGEAEALLCMQHPDRFNGRGEGKWRGSLYGAALQGLRLGSAVIYRGTFATGLFQCLYQPGPAHWATLPSTLEWHVAALTVAAFALLWPFALLIAVGMLVVSGAVAVAQAVQARLAPAHRGLSSRLVIAGLCYAQPLVRSWARYRTRLLAAPVGGGGGGKPLPWLGTRVTAYWSEGWRERTELLNEAVAALAERRWGGCVIDSGWSDWDLLIHCDRWASVVIRTTQEDHGSGKRLIRVRYNLRVRLAARLLAAVGLSTAGVLTWALPWLGLGGLWLLAGLGLAGWKRGRHRAGAAAQVFDEVAAGLGLFRCDATQAEAKA